MAHTRTTDEKKNRLKKKIDFLVQKNELAGEVKCLPSFCGEISIEEQETERDTVK